MVVDVYKRQGSLRHLLGSEAHTGQAMEHGLSLGQGLGQALRQAGGKLAQTALIDLAGRGDLRLDDLGAGGCHDVPELIELPASADEGVSLALLAGPGGPSDAVDIELYICLLYTS